MSYQWWSSGKVQRVKSLRAGHAVVSKEQPEAKDWLGKNVEDGVGDDLGIESNNTGTIGNSPNAGQCQ